MAEPPLIDAPFLAGVPIFGGVPDAQLQTLIKRATFRALEPDEVLLEEGTLGQAVYVILEGVVEIRKGGRALPLAKLGPKACIGEMSIIDIQPRSASVIALEKTWVMRMDCQTLFALHTEDLTAYTMLVMNCAREISRRLRRSNLRILALEKQLEQ